MKKPPINDWRTGNTIGKVMMKALNTAGIVFLYLVALGFIASLSCRPTVCDMDIACCLPSKSLTYWNRAIGIGILAVIPFFAIPYKRAIKRNLFRIAITTAIYLMGTIGFVILITEKAFDLSINDKMSFWNIPETPASPGIWLLMILLVMNLGLIVVFRRYLRQSQDREYEINA